MPSFSVSQVECRGSCREISSSFLRHTPENSDAKIPPSYRAGALQGASLPKLLRFLLPPAEQQKETLQSNTLPIPQQQRVQGEPGKLAMKFHFFLLTQRGYHQRTDFFFFIFRGDPRESCQAELEPGLEGSHLWSGCFWIAANSSSNTRATTVSQHPVPEVLLDVSDPDCWDLALRCEKRSAWAHQAAHRTGFKQSCVVLPGCLLIALA